MATFRDIAVDLSFSLGVDSLHSKTVTSPLYRGEPFSVSPFTGILIFTFADGSEHEATGATACVALLGHARGLSIASAPWARVVVDGAMRDASADLLAVTADELEASGDRLGPIVSAWLRGQCQACAGVGRTEWTEDWGLRWRPTCDRCAGTGLVLGAFLGDIGNMALSVGRAKPT